MMNLSKLVDTSMKASKQTEVLNKLNQTPNENENQGT